MAIRDVMTNTSAPFLAPGEQLQVVIPAQTASGWITPLAGVLFFLGINRYRIIAVTSGRILVLDTGKWNYKKASGVISELPRSTQLGPGKGVWHAITVDGKKVRVHRRFFKDLAQADSLVQVH